MNVKDGIWILPTRHRPGGIARLIDAYRKTKAVASIVVLIDDNDPHLETYKRLSYPAEFTVLVGPEMHTAQKINAAVEALPSMAFYGLLADDMTPMTEHWDVLLAAAVPQFGLSFCDDSIHGKRLPTHPVVSGDLVRALGWWAFPLAHHTGVDLYLRDIASKFDGCKYVENCSFWHFHPCAREDVAQDDTYEKAAAQKAHDDEVFERFYRGGLFDAIVDRLKFSRESSTVSNVQLAEFTELDLAVARVLVRAGLRAGDAEVDTHFLLAPGHEDIAVEHEAKKLIRANRKGVKPKLSSSVAGHA